MPEQTQMQNGLKPELKRYMVHALHKSGSVFLFHYCKLLGRLAGLQIFSDNGHGPRPNGLLEDEDKDGILAPFRSFSLLDRKDFNHICLLRNPLDILVSQYFSFGYMHQINTQEQAERAERIKSMTIDHYCLDNAQSLLERFQPILGSDSKSNVLLLRYADMVLDFKHWNRAFCQPFQLSASHQNRLYQRFFQDFEAVEELTVTEIVEKKKKRHKRKLYPGDHLLKLKQETITELTEYFTPVLEYIDQIPKIAKG